ncbi:TetR family transcriptional regulator [Kribbella sp. VKM Ac-2527]|uniref:TetR family transcriptional regulator n=1 Tax=Kribbella caucasensis TaxID=2512215 RepID=A0A4R6JDF7_9ACTN|nr:TetR/AcrR family transcriptional regulator [Kribbella sp. VKM Ac-2527]TDO33864.1 TetR family transcriptional regulator [Kribbella sp. VKM Ac-2527]
MSTQEPVRPGRKRSEESRQAILRAAFEIVAEQGYSVLTVERIAARSGVGKQTIYRWWPGKADVLLEALALKAELHIPAPDLGDLASDLRAFLAATFKLARNRQIVAVLRSLMAEAQIDEGFGQRFRESFLHSRREALREVLDRSGGHRASTEVMVDVVFGILWYRLLADHRPLDDDLVDELVTMLT